MALRTLMWFAFFMLCGVATAVLDCTNKDGSLGCACLVGDACSGDGHLSCNTTSNLCVRTRCAEAGFERTIDCACSSNADCTGGLECNMDVGFCDNPFCIDGKANCPCNSDGSCEGSLTCDAASRRCLDDGCQDFFASCRCALTGGLCAKGLQCSADGTCKSAFCTPGKNGCECGAAGRCDSPTAVCDETRTCRDHTACPRGGTGCACLPDRSCSSSNDECNINLMCIPRTCEIGEPNCPCGAGNGCSLFFDCDHDNFCRIPGCQVGDEGCACKRDGTCNDSPFFDVTLGCESAKSVCQDVACRNKDGASECQCKLDGSCNEEDDICTNFICGTKPTTTTTTTKPTTTSTTTPEPTTMALPAKCDKKEDRGVFCECNVPEQCGGQLVCDAEKGQCVPPSGEDAAYSFSFRSSDGFAFEFDLGLDANATDVLDAVRELSDDDVQQVQYKDIVTDELVTMTGTTPLYDLAGPLFISVDADTCVDGAPHCPCTSDTTCDKGFFCHAIYKVCACPLGQPSCPCHNDQCKFTSCSDDDVCEDLPKSSSATALTASLLVAAFSSCIIFSFL